MSEGPHLHSSFNVYLDSKETRWLNSMDGIPELIASSLPCESVSGTPWREYLHCCLTWFGNIAPGLALAILLAWGGVILAEFVGKTLLGFEKTPINPIMVTILLGLIMRNVAGLPTAYETGLRFAVKCILRFGITLLGLRLSLLAVGQIGTSAIPVVLGCIVAALILVTWLSRLIRLPPRLGSLIVVGTSICGASAIIAVSGLMYQQRYDAPMALNIAATTKLVRNVCMGAVIPIMVAFYHRRNASAQTGRSGFLKWYQYVPLFVVGFVALTGVRTISDLGTKAFGIIPRPM